jgi:hypothetical protein
LAGANEGAWVQVDDNIIWRFKRLSGSKNNTVYSSKVAKTEKEICSLEEAGFEYVTKFDGAKIFRNVSFSV